MLLEEESVAESYVFVLQFEADHEAFATVLLQGLVCSECVFEVFAYAGGVFYKVLILNDIQNSECCCTCEVGASECGAEHAV